VSSYKQYRDTPVIVDWFRWLHVEKWQKVLCLWLKLLYNFHGIHIIYKFDCGLQVGDQWFNLFTLFYECFMWGLGVYEFTGYVILNSIYLHFLNYIIYILYKICLV
jgi:hypothetical protein